MAALFAAMFTRRMSADHRRHGTQWIHAFVKMLY